MGDLISRSALIEELRGLKTLYGTPMTMRDVQMIHWVIGHIKEQPTAYNVDAVVEEIKQASMPLGFFLIPDARYIGEEKAVEIVRKGGVNE